MFYPSIRYLKYPQIRWFTISFQPELPFVGDGLFAVGPTRQGWDPPKKESMFGFVQTWRPHDIRPKMIAVLVKEMMIDLLLWCHPTWLAGDSTIFYSDAFPIKTSILIVRGWEPSHVVDDTGGFLDILLAAFFETTLLS